MESQKKLTMKEQVLRYVESKGSATYTEIIRFVVDTKYGVGTYDHTYEQGYRYDDQTHKHRTVNVKSYRGYYSGAFSGTNPSFLNGPDVLIKIDRKYFVKRKQK